MKLILGYKVCLDIHKPLVSGEIKNPSNFILEEMKTTDISVISLGAVEKTQVDETYNNLLISLPECPSRGIVRYIFRSGATCWTLLRFRSKLKKVTVVHSHASFLGLGWMLFAALTGHKARFFSTPHGTNIPEISTEISRPSVTNRLKRINANLQCALDGLVYRKSELNFLPSAFQGKEMTKIYKVSSEKLRTVYNGAPERYKNLGLNRSVDVLFAGRAAKKKGLETILNLARDRPALRIKCILGTERFITVDKELLDKLDACKNIEILWAVPEISMPQHFHSSKVLLCPSTGYESLPTVLIEAIAAGCIPLAPKAWGIPEVILDPQLTFQEGCYPEILDKLDRILNAQSKATNYSLAAKSLPEELNKLNKYIGY